MRLLSFLKSYSSRFLKGAINCLFTQTSIFQNVLQKLFNDWILNPDWKTVSFQINLAIFIFFFNPEKQLLLFSATSFRDMRRNIFVHSIFCIKANIYFARGLDTFETITEQFVLMWLLTLSAQTFEAFLGFVIILKVSKEQPLQR